ncbi:hypothetical protein [Marinobacter gelidimuriae]|uniref:hypothetical protein n=1 Tax=Marinobacter gelidimuriae TaxID=2739064 RepID=UPI00037B1409|nr:hypothetical protein [Marinobacter gelidimuriae]
MKLSTSKHSKVLTFGVALSLGLGVSQVVAESSDASPDYNTEIEQQIEDGQRLPILQRSVPRVSSIQSNDDTAATGSAAVATGNAMVKTLDQRIGEHSEVVSLRQDLSSETTARFNEDVTTNLRINSLLGTVGSNGTRINNLNTSINSVGSDLNATNSKLGRVDRAARNAQARADSAYSLANTANNSANSAYSLAGNADSTANRNTRDIANLDLGGANTGTQVQTKTYVYKDTYLYQKTTMGKGYTTTTTERGYKVVTLVREEKSVNGTCVNASSDSTSKRIQSWTYSRSSLPTSPQLTPC